MRILVESVLSAGNVVRLVESVETAQSAESVQSVGLVRTAGLVVSVQSVRHKRTWLKQHWQRLSITPLLNFSLRDLTIFRQETDVSVVVVTVRLVAMVDEMDVVVSVVKDAERDVEKGAVSVVDHVRIADLAQTERHVQIVDLAPVTVSRGGHDVTPEVRDAQSVLPVTSIAADSRSVSHATRSGQSAVSVPSVHDLIVTVTTDRPSVVAVMAPVVESVVSSVTIVQDVDSHVIASRL